MESQSAPGLKRNSVWMLSGQGVSTLFQAGYFVLIGRALGSHQYGEFVGAASLVSVMSQFSSLGMDSIIIRDLSRDRTRFSSVWGLSLELSTLGFLAVAAIAMIVGHFILSPEVRILLPFIAVSDALFARLSLLCSKAFQAVNNFAYTARLMALSNLARVLMAGILYLHVLRSHELSTAYAWTKIYCISSFAAALMGIVLVSKKLGMPTWARPSWKIVSEGISFSLSGSSVLIYNDIDKTYLVSVGQSSAAGIYTAAYRIVDVASTPIYGVYAAAYSRFFTEGAKSTLHACRLSLRLLKRTALYASAAAILMFFTAPVLPYVLGKSFASSTNALRWLSLLPLIRCFHYAAGGTITGSVSQWYRTTQQIAAAALNLGLNVLLIPRFSWQGAAAASLLTDGALAGMNWICVAWLIARQSRQESEDRVRT